MSVNEGAQHTNKIQIEETGTKVKAPPLDDFIINGTFMQTIPFGREIFLKRD